jgi:hypothetical protein
MKLFVKNISILVVIIIFLFLILDILVFPNNKNVYNYKASLIEKKGVEIFVSGNSHLGFGVIADSIFSYNAVNIATKARELNTDIDLLIGNIQNKKNLKAVLIPISYYSLFNELNDSEEYFIGQKRLYYNFFKIE